MKANEYPNNLIKPIAAAVYNQARSSRIGPLTEQGRAGAPYLSTPLLLCPSLSLSGPKQLKIKVKKTHSAEAMEEIGREGRGRQSQVKLVMLLLLLRVLQLSDDL